MRALRSPDEKGAPRIVRFINAVYIYIILYYIILYYIILYYIILYYNIYIYVWEPFGCFMLQGTETDFLSVPTKLRKSVGRELGHQLLYLHFDPVMMLVTTSSSS